MWGAVVLAGVIGIGIGFVAARFLRRGAVLDGPADVVAAPEHQRDIAGADEGDAAALLREAVDHLEVGVVIVAGDGSIAFRNVAASRFHGTHIGVLIDDHVATTIAETRGDTVVRRLTDLHGPPKMSLEIVAIPLPQGGVVVGIRDVSERVRADAMRTDFVTNVSHELKTPVGAIAVLAETLVGEDDPAVASRFADRIVDEAHRAVRTIDDLLELSQIESTRPGDDPVDLHALVLRAIARGRSVDPTGSVDITALESAGNLFIRGDERQLASAIGNLVENAVKYSNDGGAVQVRTRYDDVTIEVMVVDQGVGIPARDLDRVFERFYRVDRARSRETGGTGLGLSIVRHVAVNHGGEVLVSSEEGEGSTFVLRLPVSLVIADTVAVDQEISAHE